MHPKQIYDATGTREQRVRHGAAMAVQAAAAAPRHSVHAADGRGWHGGGDGGVAAHPRAVGGDAAGAARDGAAGDGGGGLRGAAGGGGAAAAAAGAAGGAAERRVDADLPEVGRAPQGLRPAVVHHPRRRRGGRPPQRHADPRPARPARRERRRVPLAPRHPRARARRRAAHAPRGQRHRRGPLPQRLLQGRASPRALVSPLDLPPQGHPQDHLLVPRVQGGAWGQGLLVHPRAQCLSVCSELRDSCTILVGTVFATY